MVIVAALASLLSVVGAQSALAAAPRPDSANGARISLSGTSFEPGSRVSFTGTGWTTTASKAHGAVLGGVKLDDTDQLNAETFTADAAGNLNGAVVLPATVSPGEHWLRFLSGTDQPGDPVRSLHVTFRVVAATKSTPAGTSASTGPSMSTPPASPRTGPVATTSTPGSGADAGSGTSGTLPKTGFDVGTTVWISGALLVAAVLLVGTDRVRRRRRDN